MPHPIHVHGCNLGVPGNACDDAGDDRRHGGPRRSISPISSSTATARRARASFSSAAAAIAERVNRSPNVSIDVGQVMFGQTVTASGDTMSQVRNARFADPKKWVAMDIECDAGCGVVPFRYKDKELRQRAAVVRSASSSSS